MRYLVGCVSAVLCAALGVMPAFGQPTFRPTFPYNPTGPAPSLLPSSPTVPSQAAVWAGQLVASAQSFRAEVNRLPLGVQQRIAVGIAADQVTRTASAFHQVTQRTTEPAAITRSHMQVDAAITNLESVARKVAPDSLTVQQSVARVRYADERLHAVLHPPNSQDEGYSRATVVRLAQALERQANELHNVAVTVPSEPGRNTQRGATALAQQSATLAADVNRGVDVATARELFAAIRTTWQALTRVTTPLAANFPAIRLQAVRVDGVYRDLERHLGGTIPLPLPPDIGVIVPSARVLVVAAGDAGGPRVRVFHDIAAGRSTDFFAYDPAYRGGVRVAVADLNGDGFPDVVTAPGRDHRPLIRVFSGRDLSLMTEFEAYDPPFTLGVYVAAADRTRDRRAFVATAPGPGGPPHIKVFDVSRGVTPLDTFQAFDPTVLSGARVALGDVNGDSFPDLAVAPGPGGPSTVKVYDGRDRNVLSEFAAFEPRWNGGLFVTIADVTRSGRAEVIVGADTGGPPSVRVFDGLRGTRNSEWFAFPQSFRGGVRVAASDRNGDGTPDVVCAAGNGSNAVRTFDGRTRALLNEFAPFDRGFVGGAFVAGK